MSPLGYYINNLLRLGIRKCVYDRTVYIVKKGINILFKKGVFKGGGHNVAKGEKRIFLTLTRAKCAPPKNK